MTTTQYPRASLYGMLFGRTPPAGMAAGALRARPPRPAFTPPAAAADVLTVPGRAARRWLPRIVVAVVVAVLAVELALGWPSLSAALAQLRTPQPEWLAAG